MRSYSCGERYTTWDPIDSSSLIFSYFFALIVFRFPSKKICAFTFNDFFIELEACTDETYRRWTDWLMKYCI